MNDILAKTPHYLMMHDHVVVGPTMAEGPDQEVHRVVFAFTDKLQYDTFWASAKEKMTPYPLVKSYLRSQLERDPRIQWLMVLDASSEHQDVVSATTFQNVLSSMENKSDSVPLTHRLTLDAARGRYSIMH